MKILIHILKMDYTLSQWFSKSKDRVVPGTAFIFLNKLTFLWLSFYLIIMSAIKVKLDTNFFVGVVVIVGGFIMYGLQKRVERYIIKLELLQEYSGYSKKELRVKRLIGVFEFIFSFIFIFIVMIIFY